MFKLSTELMEETGRAERIDASEARIVQFLRRRVPAFAEADPEQMRGFVRHNTEVGETYDITAEQSIARFCLVQVAFEGQAQNVPEIHALLSRPEGDVDQDLRNLIDGLAEASTGQSD